MYGAVVGGLTFFGITGMRRNGELSGITWSEDVFSQLQQTKIYL